MRIVDDYDKRSAGEGKECGTQQRAFRRIRLVAVIALLRVIHFIQITTRLSGRVVGRQLLINVRRRQIVNLAEGGVFIAGEHPQHAARATVIGGDHCIAARGWVADTGKVVTLQQ